MSAGRALWEVAGEDSCGSDRALQLVGRERKRWGGIVGAQHVGTERGFGNARRARDLIINKEKPKRNDFFEIQSDNKIED